MKAIAPGEIFARDFQIVRTLATGGMGTVYVALQLSTRKQRALKMMLPQLLADESQVRRFEQEARVGASIESDHVVEVVASGVDEETRIPWIAMELIAGSDLANVVAAKGPMPLAEVHRCLRQLCHAVGAAHAAGIIHRDLKPNNILLAQSRRADEGTIVKVLDFGIARIAAEAASRSTAAMGSPLWMAPEQTERGSISAAADVWAIGLITFFLLTGRNFWLSGEDANATLAQLMREIILEPIPRASDRARELGAPSLLPPWFDAWFERSVNRDPARRTADARAALAHFESLMNGGPTQARLTPEKNAMATTLAIAERPASPLVANANLTPPPLSRTSATAAAPPPTNGSRSVLFVALGVSVIGVLLVVFATRSHWWPSQSHAAADPPLLSASNVIVAPTVSTSEPTSTQNTTVENDPPIAKDSNATVAAAPSQRVAVRSSGPAAAQSVTNADPQPATVASQGTQAVQTASSPFDKEAASKVLSGIDLYSCVTDETPVGPGHFIAVFGPDGSAVSAAVDRAPFAGTAFGDCAAAKVKASHVPPFVGEPFTVGKSFTLLAHFDRAAATRALNGVDLSPCKRSDGPTGAGHLTVTFANDGSVSSTAVDQPPYADTLVAKCIASRYRSVHVPAFGGQSVKVGKGFTIE